VARRLQLNLDVSGAIVPGTPPWAETTGTSSMNGCLPPALYEKRAEASPDFGQAVEGIHAEPGGPRRLTDRGAEA